MNTLSRIWSDIRNFDNLDQYLTVALALGLSVLSLFGVGTQYVDSVTLAVLGLLALSAVASRHRIDDLQRNLAGTATALFVEEFPEDLKKNLEEAQEVWLVGVSLHRTINFNYDKLERKLKQGHKLKVMMVHPEGPGVEMAASRNYIRKDSAATAAHIRENLQLLCHLHSTAPGCIEIRTIQNPLSYGAIATNPNSVRGCLYLEHYTFGVSPLSLPRYVIRAGDGQWYDFFKREILAMWEYGVVWEC